MPFIKGLSKKFIRSAGRIKHSSQLTFDSEGKIVGKKVIEDLQSQERGYRNQEFYNDLRIYRQAHHNWQKMKALKDNDVIRDNFFAPADRLLTRKYAMVVKYNVESPSGISIAEEYITVYSDRIMTKSDWIAYARPVAEQYDGSGVSNIQPVEAYKSEY